MIYIYILITILIVFSILNAIGKQVIKKNEIEKIHNFMKNSIGLVIKNPTDALNYMQKILEPVHKILRRESFVILYLDEKNKVKDTDFKLGYDISISNNEIIKKAKSIDAKKIILGQNNIIKFDAPTDGNVYYSASLSLDASQEGIDLIDHFVVCRSSLKSVVKTLRFKQMLKSY